MRTLLGATTRELAWGLRAVSVEVDKWRAQASAIPNDQIRTEALHSLSEKRGNTDGAALFWTLPRHRDIRLLRLLVAYEIMADFLDSINEQAASAGVENGRQLHLALVEALNPGAPISNYYSLHPFQNDGGYLRSLVEACREGCLALPAYPRLRPLTLQAAKLAGVQALNHEPDPDRREEILRKHAERELRHLPKLSWFELTAATSAWLAVLVLLALAAEPTADEQQGTAIYNAYFWVCLAATMLDSYTDMDEDQENDGHSYVSYYRDRQAATTRVEELLQRAAREAGPLPGGHGHLLILCSMIALYLSKDSARSNRMRIDTRALVHAGGSLSRLLLPILRTWRIAYSLRAA